LVIGAISSHLCCLSHSPFIEHILCFVNGRYSPDLCSVGPDLCSVGPDLCSVGPDLCSITFLSLINKGFQRPELLELIEQEGATRFFGKYGLV
jgi:hypothetical protein